MRRIAIWFLSVTCVFTGLAARAQDCPQYWTVHSIYVKAGMEDAARSFYETNWLPVQREAKKRGMVAEYHLLVAQIPNNTPQIELISIFANRDQFDARVANFTKVASDLKLSAPIKGVGKTREDLISTELGQDDYHERAEAGGSCPKP